MIFLFFENLLIGKLPDALGLMLFGIGMILTSTLLRKFVGNENAADQEEAVIKEVI